LGTSWPQGQSVAVHVQAVFGDDAKNELSAGITSWNSYTVNTCSGITFMAATLEDFTVTDPIPDYTIRVIKVNPNPGGMGAIIVRKGNDGRAINADMMIHPDASFSGLRYLGAHEAGHSHGMKNCNYCLLGTSIMTRSGLINST
jgi:hypothetical protein